MPVGWLIGILLFGLAVVGVVVLISVLFVHFADSLDESKSLGSGQATLNCFHCGAETPANQKTCKVCGGELQ